MSVVAIYWVGKPLLLADEKPEKTPEFLNNAKDVFLYRVPINLRGKL